MGADETAYSQGFRWEGDDPVELARVIEAAFDYRGDVTLLLSDGSELAGYLANRDASAKEPFLDVFPSAGGERRRVLYTQLRGLELSGKDTASGKSWESWVKKWTANQAAAARGEKVEGIGLFPEELD